MNPIKQIVEEFDKQFGIDGPDKDSDSIGRGAGCDDCYENIKIRAEHRDFLTTSLTKLIESDIEWLIEQRISYLKSEEGTSHGDYGKGYNQALSDIITYKRSQLSNNN